MDPNETLNQLLRLADGEDEQLGDWSATTANHRCQDYARLVNALDTWLRNAGFLPSRWNVTRHAQR